MALVIRYRCHACGAHLDTSGGVAWLRCGYCRALVGYDWQAWFESPDYGAWLKQQAANAGAWADYQKDVEAAAKAARKGRLEKAEEHLREAITRQMALTPHTWPPEVHRDKAYRERYLRFEAWARLQSYVDPSMMALDAELQTVCRALDYRNPMPTLEKALVLLRKQLARLAALPGAEDPDGMPPDARTRVVLSLFVNAYLPMLNREQRLKALRDVHGVNNVLEAGASTTDEVGWFIDWQCPRCGLASLQARSALELCCPGCYHRRPFSSEVLGLSAVSVRCGSCGATVALAAGAQEAACGSCGTRTRRILRTGAVEQDLARQAMRESAARHGLTPEALPAQGVEGFPVTEDNRLELRLTGLARQAHWYAKLVQVSRYVELVRRSLPELSDAERAARLARVEELSASEGGADETSRKLLTEARAHLLTAR
jgi:DNA-directed RNA polymerase subunit RPC12/RpoP